MRTLRICKITDCGQRVARSGLCRVHFQQTAPKCKVEDCPSGSLTNGMCRNHYEQYRRQQLGGCRIAGCGKIVAAKNLCDVHYKESRLRQRGGCTIKGCDRIALAKGLCRLHYDDRKRTNADPCCVPGCGKPAVCPGGLCSMHYTRLLKHGDVNTVIVPASAKDRFLEGFAQNGLSACWLWTKAKSRGYGSLSVNNRRVTATRYSWELFVGPIPKGMFVLHSCDTPACVNPKHLFLGTHQDNMDDMVKKGRWSSGKRAK